MGRNKREKVNFLQVYFCIISADLNIMQIMAAPINQLGSTDGLSKLRLH